MGRRKVWKMVDSHGTVGEFRNGDCVATLFESIKMI